MIQNLSTDEIGYFADAIVKNHLKNQYGKDYKTIQNWAIMRDITIETILSIHSPSKTQALLNEGRTMAIKQSNRTSL